MKRRGLLLVSTISLLGCVCAVSPSHAIELWAMNAGETWCGSNCSYTFDPDNMLLSTASYPNMSREAYYDAAYIAGTQTLYVTGTYSGTAWNDTMVAVFTGGPDSLKYWSSSDAGLEDYKFVAGIEYLNGALYGIGYLASDGQHVLIKITNPGTALQTVTQIGSPLGDLWKDLGSPFALCSNGNGDLYACFSGDSDPFSPDPDDITLIYELDVETGAATLLHTYTTDDISYSEGPIEGLVYAESRLFGLTTFGTLYEIDTETFELTELGELDGLIWTCLTVTSEVPEPGAVVMMLGGVVALVMRRRRAQA